MYLYKEDRRPLIRYDVLFHRSLISCFLGKMPALAGLAGLPARLGRGAGTVASKPGGPVRQKKPLDMKPGLNTCTVLAGVIN